MLIYQIVNKINNKIYIDGFTLKELANKYNHLSYNTIYFIVNNKTWKEQTTKEMSL